MALVIFPTIAPYGEVVVNPAQIFAVVPDASRPAAHAELQAAATRNIRVLISAAEAAARLGPAFVPVDMVATTPAVIFVNRDLVLHILPNPDAAEACFIHGQNRRITVRGSLTVVAAQLG